MTDGFLRRLAAGLSPLWETRCAACAAPLSRSRTGESLLSLCPVCAPLLARRTGGFCSRCGNLTAAPLSVPTPCGDCLTREPPWNAFHFHAAYQGLVRELILRFKGGHELPLGDLLGNLLAAHPDIIGPYDAIVPVPLHPRRLRERGFNQALELARPLARRLGAALEPTLLARTAHTHPQAGLSLDARRKNVAGLFAPGNVAGLRILLIDDIATTCATLESAAATLRLAGASGVDVAVVARTPSHAAL